MEATAASIAFVQFAGQTVKLIVQAYQLWEQIRDLPAELADLIASLKAYEPVFREVEAQIKSGHGQSAIRSSPSALSSLEHIKRVHKVLHDMVNTLSSEMNSKQGFRRKVKAAGIVLKKGVLQNLEKRILSQQQPAMIARRVTLEIKDHLDSRQSVQQQQMAISNQTAMARMQPQPLRRIESADFEDVIDVPNKQRTGTRAQKAAERPAASIPRTSNDLRVKRPQRFYGLSNLGRYAASYAKDTGAWEAYIQFPRWISETIYEFHYAPSIAGWSFCARIYNIIPSDSEIFKRVEMGDEAGVQKLFQMRKASLFDKDNGGQSLLFYATRAKQPGICKLLLQHGLHELLDEPGNNVSLTPLTYLMQDTARWQHLDEDSSQILQLFQSYLQDPESIPVERMFKEGGQLGYTSLRPFKEKFMQRYYERPERDRLEAVRLGAFLDYASWEVFAFFKQDRNIAASEIVMSTKERLSLLHSAAVGLGRRLPDQVIPRRQPGAFQYFIFDEGWYDVVAMLGSHCGRRDLHALEEVVPWDTDPVPVWKGTPLTSLVGGVICFLTQDFQYYHWDHCFQTVLRHWVTHLERGGVDLVQYGKEEVRLLRDYRTGIKGAFDAEAIRQSRTKVRKSLPLSAAFEPRADRYQGIRSGRWAQNDTLWVPIRLIGLDFGPSPADWRLVWAPELECFACEFWRAVEDIEMAMPGGWVE